MKPILKTDFTNLDTSALRDVWEWLLLDDHDEYFMERGTEHRDRINRLIGEKK